MDYYGYNDYRYYLAHHGVLGQKWGIRRYQPYGSGGYNRIGGKKGVEKISKEDRRSLQASQKARELAIARIRKQPIDKETGLPLKTKKWSDIEDIKAINPGYNPLSEGTTMNCACCSASYELRRRGFDVCASLNTEGVRCSDLSAWFNVDWFDPKSRWSSYGPNRPYSPVNTFKAAHGKNKALGEVVIEELVKQGNGSRGILSLNWTKDSGHFVNYEIENGRVIVRDCQNGKRYDSKDRDLVGWLGYCCDVYVIKVDDLPIDYKKIKEAVA